MRPASRTVPVQGTAWRLIVGPGPSDGCTNMAVDQALAESVAAGAPPVVRLYRWSPPTLSFGRNQPARGLYDRAAAERRGIAFVRRPTGGQAVLHDDELTYSVAAPVAVIGKPRAAYARINQALVDGLRRLGVPARLAGAAAAHAQAGAGGEGHDWAAACFRRPEAGEVIVHGRKLVGSAQRMESRVILQHGSILLGGSQAAAEELLLEPRETGGSEWEREGWTTLAEAVGRRPGPEELVDALVKGFEQVLGTRLEPSPLSRAEGEAVDPLRRRFASESWTWRR